MSAVARRHPHPCQVTAVELNEERAADLPDDWEVICGNYLDWAAAAQGERRFDLIISNPPFTRWMDFIRASLPLLEHRGILLALGFSNILGSQKRAAWWKENRPQQIWQSSRRPQFRPDSQNGDPRETIWVQWGPSQSKHTKFDWLDL